MSNSAPFFSVETQIELGVFFSYIQFPHFLGFCSETSGNETLLRHRQNCPEKTFVCFRCLCGKALSETKLRNCRANKLGSLQHQNNWSKTSWAIGPLFLERQTDFHSEGGRYLVRWIQGRVRRKGVEQPWKNICLQLTI